MWEGAPAGYLVYADGQGRLWRAGFDGSVSWLLNTTTGPKPDRARSDEIANASNRSAAGGVSVLPMPLAVDAARAELYW